MAFLVLSFICRHNTQELDVWASTFTLPFYFDTKLFVCLFLPAVLAMHMALRLGGRAGQMTGSAALDDLHVSNSILDMTDFIEM